MTILVTVLAHNEEARIAACLASLAGYDVHVVVNGSTDQTALIARGFPGVTVHDYADGGKLRSWNRFVLTDCPRVADTHVFVDGDAVVAPGSIAALDQCLRDNAGANAAAGLPLNGRKAAAYRAALVRTHGMFGDLYALRGSFIARMKAAGIRLPDDLIGDDSLIGALAKTDLGSENEWVETRIAAAVDAGWYCEQTRLGDPASLRIQYRRMINYSVRHFQNRIVSGLMRGAGPSALPQRLSSLYRDWLPRFTPRNSLQWWWFDRRALAKMRAAAAADQATG
jgi:glycosyltransferase involved in cell wall biosynthesis